MMERHVRRDRDDSSGTSGNYIFLNSPNDSNDWEPRRIWPGCPVDPGNWDDRFWHL